MDFYNVGDANMYLGNSIVRLGSNPVYVFEIQAGMKAVFKPLSDFGKDTEPLVAKVKDINLLPVPLGYVNTRIGARYCMRQPERRVKQGLSLDRIRDVNGRGAPIRGEFEALSDCIRNIYPDFKAAHAAAKEMFTIIAFHRHFAVDVEGDVFYKTDIIGSYKRGKLKLKDNYVYLAELIKETFDGLL